MFIPGEEPRVGYERQVFQDFGEVSRTNLAGSACALDSLRQAERFFVNHIAFKNSHVSTRIQRSSMISSIEEVIFQPLFKSDNLPAGLCRCFLLLYWRH
jgi:hypothetical protein